MNKETIHDKKSFFSILLEATLIYAALMIHFLPKSINQSAYLNRLLNVGGIYNGFCLSHILAFVGICFLLYVFCKYRHLFDTSSFYVKFPALFFSVCVVVGKSFYLTDSWDLLFGIRNFQTMKALVMFFGYYLCFEKGIAAFYYGINNLSKYLYTQQKEPINPYLKLLHKHTFFTIFVTLFILYIPYMVISYPGIFMGDTPVQIRMAFGELKLSMNYIKPEALIKEGVYISQHHPIAHTLLIHGYLLLGGTLFGSFNKGIFLYSLTQTIFLQFCISYVLTYLYKKKNVSIQFLLVAIIYYFCHPLIHNYFFLISKDIIYAGFFLLTIILLYDLSDHTEVQWRKVVVLFGTCLGMILFRNDAKYIVLFSFLLCFLLFWKNSKKHIVYAALLISLFLSSQVFSNIFVSLGYMPGSIREMLSVPFQQTARYIRDYGDEVTEEEKEAIAFVLDYDSLAKKYDPNRSDAVKETFKENSTREELINYFRVWGSMFLKHPDVYIEATINNYYQYVYPGPTRFSNYSYGWAQTKMEDANKQIMPLGQSFSHLKSTKKLRDLSDKVMSNIRNYPIFSLLMSPGIYTWVFVLLLLYSIKQNSKRVLPVYILSGLLILICFVGPCNGYYGRYSYPIVLLMPVLLLLTRDKNIN